MSPNISIPQLSVIVLARNYNPSLLTPDFLKLNKIVSEEWEIGNPIYTYEEIYQLVSQQFVNQNFRKTFQRLWELQIAEDEIDQDDDEILVPTEYALSHSIDLLIEIYYILGDSFPLGYASVDHRGGINLIWKCRELDQEIRFNYPAYPDGLQSSVYYRKKDESELINNPNILQLSNLLKMVFFG